MTCKTILVSLNDVNRIEAILGVALTVAARNQAHVIGLFSIPTMPVYPVPGAYVMPELIENHEKIFKERAASARQAFERLVTANGVSGEFRQIQGNTNAMATDLIAHGHQADLVVIGQVNPDADSGIELDFADSVIIETGRPVLVVPYAGEFASVGERAVAGWNATREAARAIFDAIPVLKPSAAVRLVWVDAHADKARAGDLPGSEMAATLARHGLDVTTDGLPAGDLHAEDALLNCASDRDADLIVVGAYGHSRLREFALGGVTRGLLHHMTVPVLMSH